MQNFIFISPNFPASYWHFCAELKNNGMREAFNAEKIRTGIIKACEKRPVPIAVIDDLVADISKQVYNSMETEITTKAIGEMVMDGLKKIDEVAYVRYASVYRSFKDLSSFMSELKQMMKANKADKTEKPTGGNAQNNGQNNQ